MDLNKLKKNDLQSMCKEKGITKYLKKSKADLILTLIEAGVRNITIDDKSVSDTTKKPAKPRLDKLLAILLFLPETSSNSILFSQYSVACL